MSLRGATSGAPGRVSLASRDVIVKRTNQGRRWRFSLAEPTGVLRDPENLASHTIRKRCLHRIPYLEPPGKAPASAVF